MGRGHHRGRLAQQIAGFLLKFLVELSSEFGAAQLNKLIENGVVERRLSFFQHGGRWLNGRRRRGRGRNRGRTYRGRLY
ncbi:hypothetical protein ACFQT0_22440 [Hymenobacter humi]|uniref:DUF4372 domain-containing protein n=1 Tax=Hymenobacter humi TaxID=1411620 RepID=A0ABW2U8M1_9BACT